MLVLVLTFWSCFHHWNHGMYVLIDWLIGIGPHSETGSACFYSQPGANRPAPVDFFRILRVVYLKPIGDLLVDLPVVGPLSYETFTPELIKCKDLAITQRERIEKMKETFAKVTAFLQASGTLSITYTHIGLQLFVSLQTQYSSNRDSVIFCRQLSYVFGLLSQIRTNAYKKIPLTKFGVKGTEMDPKFGFVGQVERRRRDSIEAPQAPILKNVFNFWGLWLHILVHSGSHSECNVASFAAVKL